MAAVLVMKRQQQEVVAPQVQVGKVVRVRPWVRNTVLAVVLGTTMGTVAYTHASKPVLEDNVQWVRVVVEQGNGYDAAIHTAYSKVGADIGKVDVRDLRTLAMEHNNNKDLRTGMVIEVPVYMGTGVYR